MKSFFTLFVVLLSTSASGLVTLPLTKLVRTGAHLKGAPDADRARAALLKQRPSCGPITVPATSLNYSQYATRVGIGNPATYYNLVVDTGSSNTLCGTGIPYVRTPTSIPTGEDVNITYVIGFFSGIEYFDQVTLSPDLVITNQSIGAALSFAFFNNIDGTLGVGPVDLTQGSLTPDVNATVPTVMNNLMSQGLIEKQILSVYFSPATNENDTNGALTYGGTDSSLYQGEIVYAPVTTTFPASTYWGINITSCTYDTHKVIPHSTAGIVDTGTTLVILADDFFTVYLNAIPGAQVDSIDTGLIEIPPASIPYMHPLNFTIAGQVISMDVAAQLIPEDQNELWGGVSGKRYSVITNSGDNSGLGLDSFSGRIFWRDTTRCTTQTRTVSDSLKQTILFPPSRDKHAA